MTIMTQSSSVPALSDPTALERTAARLTDALGVEAAMFICRSNYWHGVLRIIESRLPVSSAPA